MPSNGHPVAAQARQQEHKAPPNSGLQWPSRVGGSANLEEKPGLVPLLGDVRQQGHGRCHSKRGSRVHIAVSHKEPAARQEGGVTTMRPAGRCWSSVGILIQMRRVQGRENIGEELLPQGAPYRLAVIYREVNATPSCFCRV